MARCSKCFQDRAEVVQAIAGSTNDALTCRGCRIQIDGVLGWWETMARYGFVPPPGSQLEAKSTPQDRGGEEERAPGSPDRPRNPLGGTGAPEARKKRP